MTIDELNSFMEEHGFFNCRNTEPINEEYVADLVQFALIDGYNKAIDDFEEKLLYQIGDLGIREIIEEIAEQLKAG